MSTVAIIAARMNSTRLKGKTLMDLCGKPVLGWVATAALQTIGVDQVWVATTNESVDDAVYNMVHDLADVSCFRGSEEDVLDRFLGCAKVAHAKTVIRLTGDCCMLDPHVIGQTLALYHQSGAAYASNVDPPTWPDGLDCEVFSIEALQLTHREATRPSDRETVTQYITRNRDRFPAANLWCPIPGLGAERWVLDTEDDLRFCREVISHSSSNYNFAPLDFLEVLSVLRRHPELRDINKMWRRNERFFASIAKEAP